MKIFRILILGFFSLIVAAIILLIMLIYVFHFNPQGSGSRDELRSVKESKEFGVFVSEYYSPDGYILYPDNQTLYIKESWIEHRWVYDIWSNPDSNCRDCNDIYGLYIVFKEPVELNIDNQDYSYQWKNGKRNFDGKGSDFRGPLHQFSIWVDNYKNEDTLKVYITKYKPESSQYDTLTSFILIKKK